MNPTDGFGLLGAVRLGGEAIFLDGAHVQAQLGQDTKFLVDAQGLGTPHEVIDVEPHNVVSRYDVRVHRLHKLAPRQQHL